MDSCIREAFISWSRYFGQDLVKGSEAGLVFSVCMDLIGYWGIPFVCLLRFFFFVVFHHSSLLCACKSCLTLDIHSLTYDQLSFLRHLVSHMLLPLRQFSRCSLLSIHVSPSAQQSSSSRSHTGAFPHTLFPPLHFCLCTLPSSHALMTRSS